jgi:carboxypeptidase PM20D1
MHVRKAIRDEAVQIHIPEGTAWEASPLTSFNSNAAKALLRVLGQVYPEAIAAPYLVAGATDSRYYTQVCDNIFRISPYLITLDELSTIHTSNERILIDGLARMVQFYIQLVKLWTEQPVS